MTYDSGMPTILCDYLYQDLDETSRMCSSQKKCHTIFREKSLLPVIRRRVAEIPLWKQETACD